MKQRIAVLGGGAGSLSTVYALTGEPDWRERFEIDVYVQGWRLGGKGASGRNAAAGQRIEEHGMHVWMGFYHNAFRMMRDAYDERAAHVADPGLFTTWQDAFAPRSLNAVVEHIDGQYRIWPLEHKTKPGEPGDASPDLAPWLHIVAAIDALRDHLHDTPHAAAAAQQAASGHDGLLARLAHRLEHGVEALAVHVELGALDLARHFAATIGHDVTGHASGDHALLVSLLEHAREAIDVVLAPLNGIDAVRRLRIVLNLGLTVLRGTLADRVVVDGFDPLDDTEFRTWLRNHGAADYAIDSALLASLYTAGFCFAGGRRERPDMAAGVALQSLLRMALCQRGPFSWTLRSGMGDVVFSPLYQVLAARGVTFHFFHRVTRLVFDATANAIGQIEMDEQVVLDRPYEPLVRVNGVDAWPSAPRTAFVRDGEALAAAIARGEVDFESRWSPAWKDQTHKTLRRGADFDLIVLGISLGALGEICADLVDPVRGKPAWADLVREVPTVVTQAQQLWFTPTVDALGWPTQPAVVQGYPPSMGQWLDASQVIPREAWPADGRPGAVLYFCDVWPDGAPPPGSDHDYPRRERERVIEASRQWLEQYPATAWPLAARAGSTGLDWRLLHDPSGGSGASRLNGQYFRVNVDPSERFVQSPAGSTKFRLTVDGAGVDGLYLTGDWTRNGFNVACVESTVIAGLQCARAIDGRARDIVDEHFLRVR